MMTRSFNESDEYNGIEKEPAPKTAIEKYNKNVTEINNLVWRLGGMAPFEEGDQIVAGILKRVKLLKEQNENLVSAVKEEQVEAKKVMHQILDMILKS